VAQAIDFYSEPLNLAALALGALSLFLTIVATIMTYLYRHSFLIIYAQVEFLFILLFGLLLVSSGSLLLTTDPTDASCNVSNVFIVLGYTIQLVPLIVKVSAIHKLITAANRMRRVFIPKVRLFGTVTAITGVVAAYLMCWIVISPMIVEQEFFLTEKVNENGETIAVMGSYCGTQALVWQALSAAWLFVMLLGATVLAFQTRNIREEFNESKTLALVIYSHFLFLIVLVAAFLFENALSRAYLVEIRSIIHSADTICTMAIYFLPKFASKAPGSPTTAVYASDADNTGRISYASTGHVSYDVPRPSHTDNTNNYGISRVPSGTGNSVEQRVTPVPEDEEHSVCSQIST